jgi:hypothetical protein
MRHLTRFALTVFLLWNLPEALAHGLEAEASVLPDGQVQVEVYYPRGGAAEGALVHMMGADGKAVAKATTDAQGICYFAVKRAETYGFEAMISGHRATCKLAADDVAAIEKTLSRGDQRSAASQRSVPDTVSGNPGRKEAVAHSVATGGRPNPAVNVVAGLGFILGLAAMGMALSQRKAIRSLQGQLNEMARNRRG